MVVFKLSVSQHRFKSNTAEPNLYNYGNYNLINIKITF